MAITLWSFALLTVKYCLLLFEQLCIYYLYLVRVYCLTGIFYGGLFYLLAIQLNVFVYIRNELLKIILLKLKI